MNFFTQNPNITAKKQNAKPAHLTALTIGMLSFALFITVPAQKAEATKNTAIERLTSPLPLPVSIEETTPTPNSTKQKTQSITVKSGDTLTHIFRRVGLNAQQVHQVAQLNKTTKALARLSPGQTLDFSIDNNKLQKLVYHIDKTQKLIIQKNNGEFEAFKEKRQYETRISYTTGSISSSLFDAAHKSGLTDNLTMDLAHIFGWDIDFALDIRKGDQFSLMYETLHLDGEYIQDGNILAAEFINRGKSFKAVRYTDKNNNSNYYSETGSSMRKAFLRSPVDFTRISSRFGKRHHPILKKRRAHKGVDYAASRGTPIKAAGDGKVTWRGRKGGYGKTVMIKHGSRYTTLYAHMNGYNRKAKLGSRVKQGQVIGYVGSTGQATGPHLHYEFRVNGIHRNPLTVKLPNAASIPKQQRSDFFAKSRPLLARLNLIKNINVALNDAQ